jgi:ectoine hydroxylase-related dioxygenase (phytanoyl-CoA dioxygenase family)
MLDELVSDPGFIIVPELLTGTETSALRSATETLPRGRAGARNALSNQAIRALAQDERLLALATGILGAPALPYKATLFNKSFSSNWLVTWHQDLALPIRNRIDLPGWGPWTDKGGRLHALAPADVLARVVALRVHLNDSTSENGPLRVLPGTHRDGRLSEERIAALAREITPVECMAPAGGVIAMRPLLLHASSKSADGSPRRVIHIEYATDIALGSGLKLDVG